MAGKRAVKHKKTCDGCAGEYPRAWCLLTDRWQHCNCGIYFDCTASDAKELPSALAAHKNKLAQAHP